MAILNVRARPAAVIAVALCTAVTIMMTPTAGTAAASPGRRVLTGQEGSAELQAQLNAASAGYNDAAARLESSKGRQARLAEDLKTTDAALSRLTEQAGIVAVSAYKGGRLGGLAAVLDSTSSDGVFSRAVALNSKMRQDNRQLRQLKTAREDKARQQAGLDQEIRTQSDQVAEMAKRKQAAEAALRAVGAGATVGGVAADGTPSASAVPRRPDGSLASESCSAKDPTTSGCLTPRTLHALQQVQAAGFTHYVSCYRSQEDGGEHPRGRACDFAASASGFGGVASGSDRDYGNRLASWLITNAGNLGVLYIIWFRQIWMPSTGWRAYQSGGGDPSSDHTNHVHLSVQ